MKKRYAPAALLLLLTVAACTPETPAPTTPEVTPTTTAAVTPTAVETTVPSPSPSPEPSATPSPTSTLSPEQEAAQAAAVEYFRALNAVRSDPNADFQPLADSTTGEFMGDIAQVVAGYRERGLVQTGENTYTYGAVGPVVDAGGVRSVEVHVCADSSGSDLVDSSGASAVDPNAARYRVYKLDVVEVGPQWRVNGGPSEAAESC